MPVKGKDLRLMLVDRPEGPRALIFNFCTVIVSAEVEVLTCRIIAKVLK